MIECAANTGVSQLFVFARFRELHGTKRHAPTTTFNPYRRRFESLNRHFWPFLKGAKRSKFNFTKSGEVFAVLPRIAPRTSAASPPRLSEYSNHERLAGFHSAKNRPFPKRSGFRPIEKRATPAAETAEKRRNPDWSQSFGPAPSGSS